VKIRTFLGAGIAAAAITALAGTGVPAHATAPTPWHTQVGPDGTSAEGMAVSGDGSTAYVVVNGAGSYRIVSVDLATGAAGTATEFPASYTAGSPAASGDTVAIAGYDVDGTGEVWTVSDGTASAIALPGNTGNSFFVQGVTTTPDGFLAVGSIDGCLVTWSWAAADTEAAEGTPVCDALGSYVPFTVTTDAAAGTVYAVIADYEGQATTEQLWNLSDSQVTPLDLPGALGSPVGMTVGPDGTVYIAGTGTDSDNTQIASIHPGDPTADTLSGTGVYPSGTAQIGLVDSQLWLGSWGGIGVLDPAGSTSYTPDSPAPALSTAAGGPQGFIATAGADYLLVPSDNDFAGAPGLLEVVAPTAPTPTAPLSGTTATVTWNAAANGGTTITSATVTATDTTAGTTLEPVTTTFFGDAGYLDGDTATVAVSGLTRGHSYTFAVTQGNGFFTSQPGVSAPVAVPLLATSKPSKVAVTGSPQVGKKLTITITTTGSWQSGAVLTYAWYAGSTKVATTATYTPKAADAGAKIKVAVTGTATGRAPATVTSAAVGPVTKPVYKVPSKPTVTGTPKVGKILTAHISGLPGNATVKYQWAYTGGQYGGTIGRPTTSTTLKVPASVRGTRIEVIAFVTVPGYTTGSAASALTAVVK